MVLLGNKNKQNNKLYHYNYNNYQQIVNRFITLIHIGSFIGIIIGNAHWINNLAKINATVPITYLDNDTTKNTESKKIHNLTFTLYFIPALLLSIKIIIIKLLKLQ